MAHDLAEMIRSLSQPAAFPFAAAEVEVHQTHISVVFLAGDVAYKVKKPVNLGFLDFSTLEKRRHFCEEEVRLNRRLAPHIYQGVAPITATPTGFRFEGDGPAIEWAVKMTRLSAERDLDHCLKRGEIDAQHLTSLAERIAAFHASSVCDERIARQARWEAIDANAMANFEATRRHIGETVSPDVFERLRKRTRGLLDDLRPLIERRAAAGVPRDTHGDLRLDHVYWFPETGDSPCGAGFPACQANDRQAGTPAPFQEWVILDCIEFNEQFRFADPVADIAFLIMDFAFAGRWDLADALTHAYFQATGDDEGRALVPLYASYRAAVRGKVEGIVLEEKEIPATEKEIALQRAKEHWLAALAWAEPRERRPMIVLVGGLPGSGKSTLARALEQLAGFSVLRSDLVRKELAGPAAATSAPAEFGQGIYSEAWDNRTYDELERRAESLLWRGSRVLIDASLRVDQRRLRLLKLAQRWGVPIVMLHCQAAPDVSRKRLLNRRNDASDADWTIYETAAQIWEPFSPEVERIATTIDTDGPLDAIVAKARTAVDGHCNA